MASCGSEASKGVRKRAGRDAHHPDELVREDRARPEAASRRLPPFEAEYDACPICPSKAATERGQHDDTAITVHGIVSRPWLRPASLVAFERPDQVDSHHPLELLQRQDPVAPDDAGWGADPRAV